MMKQTNESLQLKAVVASLLASDHQDATGVRPSFKSATHKRSSSSLGHFGVAYGHFGQ